jgi:hypothetical protein
LFPLSGNEDLERSACSTKPGYILFYKPRQPQPPEELPAEDGRLVRVISSPGIVLASLPLKYRNDATIFSKSSFSDRLPVSATKAMTLAYLSSFALLVCAT